MYRFIRALWFRKHDLRELSDELASEFTPVRPFKSSKEWYMGRELGSFLVRADTLYALLEPDRATLFQKEEAPFSRWDLELRERTFKLYPHTFRASASFFTKEPHFEIRLFFCSC